MQVQENLAALRAANLTVADVELRPLPLSATFFSDRSPSVSRRLSELVYKKIKGLGLLDGRGYIAEGGAAGGGRAWQSGPLSGQLPRLAGCSGCNVLAGPPRQAVHPPLLHPCPLARTTPSNTPPGWAPNTLLGLLPPQPTPAPKGRPGAKCGPTCLKTSGRSCQK